MEGHAVGQAAANVVAVSQAGALPAGAGVLPFPERPPRAGRSLSPRGPHTTLSGGVLGNGPRRGRQAGDAVRGQGHLPSEPPPESAGGRGAGGLASAGGRASVLGDAQLPQRRGLGRQSNSDPGFGSGLAGGAGSGSQGSLAGSDSHRVPGFGSGPAGRERHFRFSRFHSAGSGLAAAHMGL